MLGPEDVAGLAEAPRGVGELVAVRAMLGEVDCATLGSTVGD